MIGKYTFKVDADFIKRRDAHIERELANPKNKGKTADDFYYRWDCELPEYHQSLIDPNQTLTDAFEYDTIHKEYHNLDYKIDSEKGVHVSDWIQAQIDNGYIDNLVIWRWLPRNIHRIVREDMDISYEILAIVNAKEAKRLIKKNRFDWRKVNERVA